MNKLVLRYNKRLIICHDVINNSISEHKSNWCPINDTRRQDTPDLSLELQKTGILILEVENNLTPKQLQDAKLIYELSQVHPESNTELLILSTVLRNSHNLVRLVKKVRSQKKPNKRQKDRIKKRQLAESEDPEASEP